MAGFKVQTRSAPLVSVSFAALDPIAQLLVVLAYVIAAGCIVGGLIVGARWMMSFGLGVAALGGIVESAAWRALSGNLAGATFVAMELYPKGAVTVVRVDREDAL